MKKRLSTKTVPSKIVNDIMERLAALEQKMTLHFEESSGIRTKLDFLVKAFWVAGGTFLTFVATLTVAILVYLLNH